MAKIDFESAKAARLAALQAEIDAIKKVDVAALEAKRAKHYETIEKEEAAIVTINTQIQAAYEAAGISSPKAGKSSRGAKKEGIKVGLTSIMGYFKEHGNKISTRKLGLDIKSVKDLVAGNPDKFKLTIGTWPVLELKK